MPDTDAITFALYLVGAVFGLAGVIGGAIGISTRGQVRALREDLEHEQTQRDRERAECRREVGELRGQVTALRSDVIDRLLTDLRPAIVDAIREGMAGQ